VRREDGLQALSAKRADSGQKLVHGGAERVKVAAAVDRPVGRCRQLLRRGVAQLAQELVGRGQVLLVPSHLGDPEIDQFGLRGAVLVAAHKDVVGRDVAMDDAALVEVPERREALPHERQPDRNGNRTEPAHEVREVRSVDVLHDHVGGAVRVHREVVERHDVRMLQPRRGLRLADESLALLGAGGDLRVHHLDDPQLVQEAMPDLVDRPHAALADLGDDLVLPVEEPRSRHRVRVKDSSPGSGERGSVVERHRGDLDAIAVVQEASLAARESVGIDPRGIRA
jgi:hypothetical protein